MDFIKLTQSTGGEILINLDNITSIGYCDYYKLTMIYFDAENYIYAKETVEEINVIIKQKIV